ncbi:hypothetical protein HMPREF9713_00639 [Myroides odoratimimus CCUG 12700]|uniref:ATP-binding protein n=1 Tax=Myroides odoratimimus TaxID=76832 RepID=UPI0003544845|nr:ATP-binding protein [Myroides odoratimimus]EPH13459.1 hypothetical protein HMPREF9713_00639 [Myroides odoratimimus CCUG 12700]
MKKLRQINFLFVVLALLLVNCNRSKILEGTDYDQLYAVWYSNDYRDSLAETLKPSVEKALSLKNSADNRVFIDSVLNQLRWTRDSISFHKLSRRAIRYAKDKSDEYALANVYSDIGMYHHDLGVLDSTFYYYIKAENIYREIGDSMKMGELGLYQARVLFEKGLFIESESKLATVLTVLDNYPSSPVPFEANGLMGVCLLNQNDYEGAKVYLLKALKLMQNDAKNNKLLDNTRLQVAKNMLYYNLSETAYYLKDYQEASDYATKGLTHVIPETPTLLKIMLESSIAKAEFMYNIKKNNKFNGNHYIKQVEDAYQEAAKVNNSYMMDGISMIIAHLYLEKKDSIKAFQWAEKAYQFAVERDVKIQQKEALEFLVTNQNYENRDRVKSIIVLNNDIAAIDYQTRNRFARIAYETEKVVTENDELKNVILMVVITSLVIILGLSAGVFIYRLRNKNRELNFIKEQQEANESIYQLILEKSSIATDVKNSVRNKIAKDLHDGVVNGIFTIRFNLQQLEIENESLKNTLINELEHLEKGTRGLSHSLIDNELFKETKFVSLVEDLALLQKNQWNTRFKVEYSDAEELEELSAIDKVNTYYIIKEAIQNINKYSEASLCTISFIGDTIGVFIKIKDNGKGFDKNIKGDGIGIQSMKERAIALNSELVIYSEKGMGTEIIFKVKNNIN